MIRMVSFSNNENFGDKVLFNVTNLTKNTDDFIWLNSVTIVNLS